MPQPDRLQVALFGQGSADRPDSVEPIDAYMPPSDLVDALYEQWEGEDPNTGLSPVGLHVLDFEPSSDDPNDEIDEIAFDDWSDEAYLLSKIPAEALFYVMREVTEQEDWWDNELEVLLEDLRDAGYTINPGGIARLQALKAMCSAPDGGSLFHRDWRSFCFLAKSLNGIVTNWDTLASPTPLECAVAIYISLEIRPEPFDPDVYRSVAATCMTYGVWCLPDVLAPAQPFVYEIARYEKYPVTPSRVGEVQSMVAEFFSDDSKIPERIDETNASPALIQAFEVYSLIVAIRRAYYRGQRVKDHFLKTSS